MTAQATQHEAFAEQVGAAIRAARRRLGMTQEELAELIGVSDRTMRSIEQGKTGVSFDSVIRAAQAVGVRWEVRTS
ncbi:helix-turn-helix transcriptional regulator [Schaalia sp. Marseille-Q2122]|uniref:helix-turn-helix transcriptional regulator n=1 Tax=Schaalia sp. Marseille-Q2122 TaxID=2736604 RepID=UPI00158E0282|nr:helix-turn-helix domain-containing protein [Schaalia sp. Marseille-Q2122]